MAVRFFAFLAAALMFSCGGGGSKDAQDNQAQDIVEAAEEAVEEIAEEIPQADEGDIINTMLCNPVAQTGCTDDENCIYNDNNELECVIKGTVPYGGDCGGVDSCEYGQCANLNGTGSKCYQYCKLNADCATKNCLKIDGVPWRVCSLPPDAFETCNLLQQDCKSAQNGCYYTGLTTEPICLNAGTAKQLENCSNPGDCAKGFACLNGKCYQLCDKEGGDPKCENPEDQCGNYYGKQNAGLCLGG